MESLYGNCPNLQDLHIDVGSLTFDDILVSHLAVRQLYLDSNIVDVNTTAVETRLMNNFMVSLQDRSNFPSLREMFIQPDGNWIYSWDLFAITVAELDEWVYLLEA